MRPGSSMLRKSDQMENIIIRDYIKKDYPGLIELWKETGLWDPERNDTESNIATCLKVGGRFLIMEDPGKDVVIGSSWITFDGRRLYLHHFCIASSYQGKGFGTKLAKASLAYVHSAGHQVKIEVHKENHIAKHLYEKLGFILFSNYDIFMIRDVKHIPFEYRS